MLQTRKSPSAHCTASISDFCLEEDACQASPVIGEGLRGVDKVWRMVKFGTSDAIKTEPF